MLRGKYSADISLLEIPGMEISSSDIRQRIASGTSVRYMLPQAVADYARRHRLYRKEPFSFLECKNILSSRLSERRFTHTMGVVRSAEELAEHYGADKEKARMAALLHDCAKEYSEDKKRALCAQWGIPIDDVLDVQISITHSLLSAESAMRDYGISDGEILQAIRFHTTGSGHMTLLDKIVMLADFIEDTREQYEGLKEIRALAYKDINKALRVGIKETIRLNERLRRPVHRWSRDALKCLS
jgi:nicotinate-nucleotide adenylyltransferase